MTIEPEMLMAYADGEADPLTAKRVERAMAADPALAAEVERQRALTAKLRAAYGTLDAAPVPAGIAALLQESARVTPMPARRAPARGWWGAIAASLVAGVVLGQFVPREDGGSFAQRGGATVAAGSLDRALATQLASTQPQDAPVRIGLTFRNRDAALCRTFEQAATSGIACSRGDAWRIERLYAADPARGGGYRQAGASAAMADAQAMMAGDPLDAAAEREALGR